MNLKLNKKVAGHVYEGVLEECEVKIEKGVSNKKTYWYSYIKDGGYWKLISYCTSFNEAKNIIEETYYLKHLNQKT